MVERIESIGSEEVLKVMGGSSHDGDGDAMRKMIRRGLEVVLVQY